MGSTLCMGFMHMHVATGRDMHVDVRKHMHVHVHTCAQHNARWGLM
jgi:hypothetical protein